MSDTIRSITSMKFKPDAALYGGAASFTLAGLPLAYLAIPHPVPSWALPYSVLMAVLGIVLTGLWTVHRRTDTNVAPPGSKFIKGHVQGSSLWDVDSEAETFIDGSVGNSVLGRIRHRPDGR